MLKRIFSLMVAVMMFSTLTVGCQPAKKPDRTPDRKPNAVEPKANTKADKRAEQLAKEATKVKGVRKAVIVISENTAYVGIDLKPKITGKETEAVKEAVADRVENADKRITRTYVTSDVGLVTRIRRIADDIAEGKPVTGFASELTEIGQRIAPDSSRE